MPDFTALERPAPHWRYIVQRATTHEILDREANLSTDDEEYVLSGVGSATFVTTPVVAEAIAADGKPMYGKRRTLIAAEADGEIRWRGIVTGVDETGATRTITAHSISTYPAKIPYLGPVKQYANADPADIIRDIWAHVQSYTSPASDLGVRVVGDTTIRVGSESTARKIAATNAYAATVDAWHEAIDVREAAQDDVNDARRVYSARVKDVSAASEALRAAKAVRPKNPTLVAQKQTAYDQAVAARTLQGQRVDAYVDIKDAKAAIVRTKAAAKSKAFEVKKAATAAAKDDGGSIDLLWWEAPMCGETISTITSDNGIDWYERHRWNADESDIISEIVLAYPRAGRRRRDLTFTQAVNMTIVPTVEDNDDDYANTQVLIGAGEGAGAIRRETSTEDGALRSVAVISAKDVKTRQVADKRLKTALPASLVTEEISSIEVSDHVLAPIGSWQVGDDIRVDFYSATQQRERKIWHRITSWVRTSDRTATITLKRSNAYTYGG